MLELEECRNGVDKLLSKLDVSFEMQRCADSFRVYSVRACGQFSFLGF